MTTTDPAASGGRTPLLQRVKNILLTPGGEWESIAAEPTTVRELYLRYACILAAIPAIALALGQLMFARATPTVYGTFVNRVPIGTVIASAIASYVASLAIAAALALLIEQIAPNFGGRKDRIAAFKVAVFSMTSVWLAGVLNLFPSLVGLGTLLGLYSLFLLYLGLPRVVGAAPEKALVFTGVVIVAAIVLTVIAATIVGVASGVGAMRLA